MADRDKPQRDGLSTRALLVRALREDGLGALCKGEPRSHEDLGTRLSYVLTSSMALGITFVLADWFEWGFYPWLWETAGLLLAAVLFSLALSPQTAAFSMAAIWLVLVVAQLIERHWSDFLLTVGLPFLLTSSAVWAARGRRLTTVARSSPLLLPVTLTVLLIPLFTADLWLAVDALETTNFLIAALLTVGPLLLIVRSRVRHQVPGTLEEGASRLLGDTGTRERAVARVMRLVEESDRSRLQPRIERELTDLYPAVTRSTADAIVTSLRSSLRAQVIRRLLTTAIGLSLTVSLYLYVLAWALIDTGVARKWTGRGIPTELIDLPTGDLYAPLGPYVAVASLLGIVATAVLLAFASTEDRYARDLSGAVLRDPLDAGLPAAFPYQLLRDREPPTSAPQA